MSGPSRDLNPLSSITSVYNEANHGRATLARFRDLYVTISCSNSVLQMGKANKSTQTSHSIEKHLAYSKGSLTSASLHFRCHITYYSDYHYLRPDRSRSVGLSLG